MSGRTKIHLVSGRVRSIHEEILRLVPQDTRRNVRVALPEARDGCAMVRVSHVDALDVARLSQKFPDVRIYARDSSSGGACIDVYVPYSTSRVHVIAKLVGWALNVLAAVTLVWGGITLAAL